LTRPSNEHSVLGRSTNHSRPLGPARYLGLIATAILLITLRSDGATIREDTDSAEGDPPVSARIGAEIGIAVDYPTYTEHIWPLLAASFVECHRPGGIAPMSLMISAEVRAWANSIRTAVASRQVPPRKKMRPTATL